MNGGFKEGTVIKGEDLKGHILCKIISRDMVMNGFQYKMGMNTDVKQLAVKGSCKAGLHFCLIKDICNYLHYGSDLALVGIPDDEDVYVDMDVFRTHRLEIRKIMPISGTAAWKYLCENGADITVWDNDAVRRAARNGYLETVKYLHENGADITADDNYAVRYAASCGHLEIVKYLYENGADITADDNGAVRWAAFYGKKDVVDYLKGKMQ